jgi:hypothetical protein
MLVLQQLLNRFQCVSKVALARAEELPHDGGEIDKARAEVLRVLAELSLNRDLRTSQKAAQQSVTLARQIGDTKGLAWALQTFGWVSSNLGDHQAGQTAAKESIALARQAGNDLRLAFALRLLGLSSAFLGDITLAFDSLYECEAISRRENYKHMLAWVLGSLAYVTQEAYGHKHDDQVKTYLEESLALSYELGDLYTMMDAEGSLALIALSRGILDEARMHIARVLAFYNEMGDRLSFNQFQSSIAHTWRAIGNFREAFAIYRHTILFWREIDHRGAVAHQLECFAYIAMANEQGERAVKLLSVAETLREFSDSPMTPTERAEYDRVVAELRAGMDEMDFVSLWAEGRSLTMEQAIEFALEERSG